jgi:two-component system sensor histidine kinase UhpB
MEELIALARQLRPAALDDHGLVPALVGQVRRFREQTGIRADAETSGDLDGLDDDQQVAIYRVAQEALNNVARHSGARSVGLRLEGRDEAVELTVEDDGRGFRRNGSRRGLGLEGMAERARLIGGDLDVSSGDGRGTRIRLSLPRKGAPA